MPAVQETVDASGGSTSNQYRYGFETLIESDKAPKGCPKIRSALSPQKNERPGSDGAWRPFALADHDEPQWARVHYPKSTIRICIITSARSEEAGRSLDEIDPEILKTYENSAFPCVSGSAGRRVRLKVSARLRSMPCSTRSRSRPRSNELKQAGVIFMPISEAIANTPTGEEVSRHGGADSDIISPR